MKTDNTNLVRFFFLMLALTFVYIQDNHSQETQEKNYTVEKIAEGFQFVEGPVWMNDLLLFSDIPANTVYQWSESGGTAVFLNPSGNSNGLALDLEGNLLLAQHGKRQVAKLDSEGNETPLATHYQGKRLNSPNDITVKSNGSIYFTDPPYGLGGAASELGFYGIFVITPNGKLHLLDQSLNRPNGIALSPDETKLYVSDSEAKKLFIWDLVNDTTVENKAEFASMSGSGSADGMKVDEQGIIYATGPRGIWIYEPDGTLITVVDVPGQTTNCGWGGENKDILFITSGSAVYQMTIEPVSTNTGLKSNTKNLFAIYPNPVTNSVNLVFNIDEPQMVKFDIIDAQGRSVSSIGNIKYFEGIHQIQWNPNFISEGTYFISMICNNGVRTKQIFF